MSHFLHIAKQRPGQSSTSPCTWMWSPNIFINNASSYFSYQNENKEINITHSNVTKINNRNITLLYKNKVEIIIAITDNNPNIMATKSNYCIFVLLSMNLSYKDFFFLKWASSNLIFMNVNKKHTNFMNTFVIYNDAQYFLYGIFSSSEARILRF